MDNEAIDAILGLAPNNRPVLHPNLCDNQRYVDKWVVTDNTYLLSWLSSINFYPFVDAHTNHEWLPTIGMLQWSAHLRLREQNGQSRDAIVGLIGDILMPEVVGNRMPINDARAHFIRLAEYLVRSIAVYSEETFESFVETLGRLNYYIEIAMPSVRAADPPGAVIPFQGLIDNHFPDMEAAMRFMYWLARHARGWQTGGLRLLMMCYISIAKRGNVTEDFINKVVTGVQEDLRQAQGINIDTVSIHRLYVLYGPHINANNVGYITVRWRNMLPDQALRLQLTLSQITGSGLTSLVLIGRAVKDYPDFRWDRVKLLIPIEVSHALEAMQVVGRNPYFGFNHNMGAARSTRYKSLAYVAKEILIKAGGEGSLRGYQGFTNNPRNKRALDQLINDYVNARANRAMEEAYDANAFLNEANWPVDIGNMIRIARDPLNAEVYQ